jgi:hypothetical protein
MMKVKAKKQKPTKAPVPFEKQKNLYQGGIQNKVVSKGTMCYDVK